MTIKSSTIKISKINFTKWLSRSFIKDIKYKVILLNVLLKDFMYNIKVKIVVFKLVSYKKNII